MLFASSKQILTRGLLLTDLRQLSSFASFIATFVVIESDNQRIHIVMVPIGMLLWLSPFVSSQFAS